MASLVPLPADYRLLKTRLEQIESQLNALSGRRLQVSSISKGQIEITGEARIYAHNGGRIVVGDGGAVVGGSAALAQVEPTRRTEILRAGFDTVPSGPEWTRVGSLEVSGPDWAGRVSVMAWVSGDLALGGAAAPVEVRVSVGESMGPVMPVAGAGRTGFTAAHAASSIPIPADRRLVTVEVQTADGATIDPDNSAISVNAVVVWEA